MLIADLHCDLLSFLAEDLNHNIQMGKSRTSHPQMKQGGVGFQTLAIFTQSKPGSFASGQKQLKILNSLLENHPDCYTLFSPKNAWTAHNSAIQVLPAFENACGFSEEGAPLQTSFTFLETLLERYKRIFYISLTWDGENRFGGGAFSKVGLKEDGKHLLDWMDKKNIALDFSHTSDYLADDLLNYIDKHSLSIPIVASHSNARSISNRIRNLPDIFIQEIIARKGLIGLNFFAPFIGQKVEDIAAQVQHFLALGGQKSLCFGADFFYEPDLSYLTTKYQSKIDFFPELSNASCYPFAISLLQKMLKLSEDQIHNLAHQNIQNYLTSHA